MTDSTGRSLARSHCCSDGLCTVWSSCRHHTAVLVVTTLNAAATGRQHNHNHFPATPSFPTRDSILELKTVHLDLGLKHIPVQWITLALSLSLSLSLSSPVVVNQHTHDHKFTPGLSIFRCILEFVDF